ncbi:hypothetical protein GW17_00012626 [Ensete ventricosum]|nr:hypothetical protein GW17_00012626 [Ensete ventricosum]RZS15426.1 hypothetical protein BHM03_00047262 [Ensete ventricosum]
MGWEAARRVRRPLAVCCRGLASGSGREERKVAVWGSRWQRRAPGEGRLAVMVASGRGTQQWQCCGRGRQHCGLRLGRKGDGSDRWQCQRMKDSDEDDDDDDGVDGKGSGCEIIVGTPRIAALIPIDRTQQDSILDGDGKVG